MLENKVVLITGSARGIGAAAAERAKEYGADVILHDKEESESLKALAKKLGARFIVADVSDKGAVSKAIGALKAKRIDVLVNCAGMAEPMPFLEANDDHWLRLFKVNLLGIVHFCQAVVPLMLKQKYGRIVNIASIRGHEALASNRTAAYSVTKAAVINLTVSLAKEYAPHIAVNAVSPGYTATDMAKTWNDAVRAQIKTSLVGRAAEPKEIAEAILFLASDRASFITGQVLLADGGYTVSGK
jgi:3-oxoacyl-[acyl-carrier protein] reductase